MYNNVTLPDGKYLDTVLTKLPHKKIIYKYFNGCGETQIELRYKRNRILIEKYIPVILGKASEKIFPVHGDVHTDDIVDYLSKKRKYYKIVSTPEGLRKIINACIELDMNIYKMFFLVVDECEKLIQDVDFRPGIIEVMDEFFKFKKSSFISATPIPPSDPRFKEKGFEDFFIHPQTKTPIPIDLYSTNNLASTIKNYFNKHKADHYLIFINSTERIASVAKFLGIEEEMQVFCAEASVNTLKADETIAATDLWDVKKLKKYNALTSRFFTAFDMKLDFKPNVLIISDVVKVAHTALDPETDIIQIIGRARNGVNHIAHITNWDAGLESKSPEEIKGFIDGSFQTYNTIRELRDTTNNPDGRKLCDEALDMISFKRFVNQKTGNVCHYMWDNELHSHAVRGYYKSASNLILAYENTKRFKVNHIAERYNLQDKDMKYLEKGLSDKKTIEYITEAIHAHISWLEENPFSIQNNHAFNSLVRSHKILYKYYRELGIDKIRELDYKRWKIEREYTHSQIKNSTSYLKLNHSLDLRFNPKDNFERLFTTQQIQKTLTFLYRRYNIILPATVAQLRKWFHVRRTTVGYREDGTEIKKHKILGRINQMEIPASFRQ